MEKLNIRLFKPSINKAELNAVKKVFDKSWLGLGGEVKKFENEFCKFVNSKYAVGVNSGTAALNLAVQSFNFKKNKNILVNNLTFVSSASCIINNGLVPNLIDCDEDSLGFDINDAEKKINKNTVAIIIVHYGGVPANLSKIIPFAKRNNLKIIEDCAQAQGAKYKNKFVGNFGDFGCFSFYPTKILGTYGDGGFIVARNLKDYEKIKRLRFYGIETSNKKNIYYNKYYANENGLNSRLDEIQCSILNIKIKYVNNYISQRKRLANLYLKYLKETNLKLPKPNKNNHHVYHLFTVRHLKRNIIIKLLNQKNIGTRIIYPFPISSMNGYKKFNFNNKELKNTIKYSKEIFSLPLYPELKATEVKKICNILKEILKKIK